MIWLSEVHRSPSHYLHEVPLKLTAHHQQNKEGYVIFSPPLAILRQECPTQKHLQNIDHHSNRSAWVKSTEANPITAGDSLRN